MSKPTILIVDDEQIILKSIKEQLFEGFGERYYIETAEDGHDALDLFDELKEEQSELVVVISDHIMPGVKGDELLKQFHERSPETIKIMLTGQADTEAVGNAVNYACLYRYISKPWEKEDLILTVSEAARRYFSDKEIAQKNQNLEEMNVLLQQKIEVIKQRENELEKHRDHLEEMVNARTGELQETNNQLKQEITERKRIEKQLRVLATTDPLTGTYNRRHFMELAQTELSKRYLKEVETSILVMDIDHLKRINDGHGQTAGDVVIKATAAACQTGLQEGMLLGRLVGGEFAILVPGVDSEGAIEIAEHIREKISATVVISGPEKLRFTTSIGIATGVAENDTLTSLLNFAYGALSRAKAGGRNRVVMT
ncbi:diguanylate cyclase [Thermodesulfobacteriota bacterium]